MITLVAIGVLAVLVPAVVHDITRRPLIRRLGLRNVARRRGESTLVVLGSMIGTSLIVASFIVGDSFGASIRNRVEADLGPIDVLVTSDDATAEAERLRAAGPERHGVDGVLAVRRADVVAANARGRLEPNLTLWEADPVALKAFGDRADRDRVAAVPDDLAPREIVINRRVANELAVGAGDRLAVVAGEGRPNPMTVRAVVEARGVTSFADVITAPCALSCDPDGGPRPGFQPVVVLSNTGDALTGVEHTADVLAFVEDTLGRNSSSFAIKELFLDRSELLAEGVTTQFAAVSGFSVASGVLLLISLLVMLALERTVELGTMRAVGVPQSTLRRAFAVEVAVYGLASTVIGVAGGIGLARIIIAWGTDSFGVERGFVVEPSIEATALGSGAAIGAAITMLAGTATSDRITRIDIVPALRLGARRATRGADARASVVLAAATLLAAVVVELVVAVGPTRPAPSPVLLLVAPVAGALALGPLLAPLLGRRFAVALAAGLALLWAAAGPALTLRTNDEPPIAFFLIQGLLMVGTAAAIVTLLDRRLAASVQRRFRRSVAGRLGLTNPLAWPVRSGLLLAMYALVLFTITFVAVLNTVLDDQGPRIAAEGGGGYDLVVHSSSVAPLPTPELATAPEVAAVVAVEAGVVVIESGPEPTGRVLRRWGTALPEAFVRNDPPPLSARQPGFASDAEAWAAVVGGDDLVIAADHTGFEVGEIVTVVGPDGVPRDLTVAGVNDQAWLTRTDLYLPGRHADRLLVDRAQFPARHLVVATPGIDPATVAARIEERWIANGVDADSFVDEVEARARERRAFVDMLQAFLAVGFATGVTGLAVVLVRSVRDRRHQLGVLRAMGFDSAVLRNSFLVEAAFIGVRGAAVGIGLGLLMAWLVLTRSPAFDQVDGFAVPARFLMVLTGATVTASMLAGLVPAIKAGRTPPAEALRSS